MLKKIVFGSIIGALNLIIGRAIVAAINAAGYFPGKWLAGIMINIWPTITSKNALWIIAGILAVLLLAIELWIPPTKKLFIWLTKSKDKVIKSTKSDIANQSHTPNFSAWDQISEFTLLQAAFLWAEFDPNPPTLQHLREVRADTWLQMLEEAVQKKELFAVLNLKERLALQRGENIVDMHTRVQREELLKFAHKRKINPLPRFLDTQSSENNINNLDEYMPLQEAAKYLYESLREFDKDHAQIVMAESGNNTPDKILEYFAITISIHAEIFGKRPPSSKLEKIDQEELNKGDIISGGSKFKYYNSDDPIYVDITVKSSELPRILDWLKSHDRFA